MDPLVDAFTGLLAQPQTDAQLKSFGQTLPTDAFRRLAGFLERPASTTAALRTSAAFQVFCQVDGPFRGAVAEYALTLPAGIVNRLLREVLTSLVKGCEAHPDLVHDETFRAFAQHRGYWQASTVAGRPDVGDLARDWLGRYARLLMSGPAPEFVQASTYALATQRLPSPEALAAWPRATRSHFEEVDAQLMNELLHRLMSDEVLSELGVGEVLVMHQVALLEAFGEASRLPRFAAARDALSDALLRHLNHVLSLWTRTFDGWHWIEGNRRGFSPESAHDAESLVRDTIVRLAGGPTADGPRLMDAGAADRYTRLVGLMGGWDWPPNPLSNRSTIPDPSWERDLERAFLGSLPALPADPPHPAEESRLNLAEAIPIHALIRLSQRLLRLERGPVSSVALRDETEVYLTDTVIEVAAETVAASAGQGVLPSLPLGPDGPPHQTAVDPSPYVFGAMSNSRTALSAPLHADFRRALSIVLASFYAWKADILYRELGARHLDRMLGSDSTSPVQSVYEAAQSLLQGLEEKSGSLGIAGRMMDLLLQETRNECALRVAMLKAGQDYGGAALRAATLEPNDLERAVESILHTLGGLTSLADLDDQRKALESDVSIAVAALERDEDLLSATEAFLEADQFTQRAIEHEAKQQAVRVAVAELRKRESEWHVAAQRYAVQAAQGNADAAAKFKEAKDLETERLHQQVEKLRSALDTLLPDLVKLRDEDIPQAQTAFDQFKAEARTSFNRKQAQRSLFTIVKRIGSLVSMYFTGVDLVSIAETAYSVYRAADSGDWLSAVQTAAEGADRLSGGKLSAYLRDAGETAKSYVGSLIPDSLKNAADQVGRQLGLDSNDAMRHAVVAIGRQTFRLGVSFLAEETHTTALAQKLGLPSTSTALQELREDVRDRLFQAGYDAIAKQGPEVLAKAEQILGVAAGGLAAKLRTLVPDGPTFSIEFDQKLVDLIRRIQADLPQADIAILKAEMLNARDDVMRKAKGWAGAQADRLQDVLDRLIEDALGGIKQLPPAPLPENVAKTLRDFHASVEKGRAQVAFLTSPGKAQELANQISEADDQQQFEKALNDVTKDLQGRIDSARQQVAQAADDLSQLKDQLDGLRWDEVITDMNAKAQTYLAEAAGFTTQLQEALASAAAESLLAGEQVVKIEQIGTDIVQERLNAQKSVVEGRKLQVDAARATVTISGLNLRRARERRDRFALNNTAQGQKERTAIARAKAYYRERAKGMLIQAYQLVSLYEFDLSTLPELRNFQPVFKPMKDDLLQRSLDALKQARNDWKYQRIEDLRVLFSIAPNVILNAVGDQALKEILIRYFTGIAVTVNSSLELTGADLPRLARGMSFRLLPRELPSNMSPDLALDAPPIETSVDASQGLGQSALTFVPRRIQGWNDRHTYRIRVLGVILEISAGVLPNSSPQFYLAQESGFVIVPDNAHRLAIEVPLERTTANAGDGVALTSGPLVTRGVNVWPLFGTYTLSTPDRLDIDPATFRARLHFVAVGSPA